MPISFDLAVPPKYLILKYLSNYPKTQNEDVTAVSLTMTPNRRQPKSLSGGKSFDACTSYRAALCALSEKEAVLVGWSEMSSTV